MSGRGPTGRLIRLWNGFPDLVYHAQPAGDAVDVVTTYTYGDPYPADWGRVVVVDAWFQVEYPVPGSDWPATASALVNRTVTLEALGDQPLVPQLGPPLDPRIGGADAFQPQQGVGLTPVLSWEPPSLGSPTEYVILLHRLDVELGWLVQEARIATTGTELLLPAGLLEPGERYVAIVFASTGTHDDRSSASVLTALFAP